MTMYRQAAATAAEKELTQAVHRVVERYGSDLSVFFRHVQEVTNKNAQTTSTKDAEKGSGDTESAA